MSIYINTHTHTHTQTDEFAFYDWLIGEPVQVSIWHDGKGTDANWFLESVTVQVPVGGCLGGWVGGWVVVRACVRACVSLCTKIYMYENLHTHKHTHILIHAYIYITYEYWPRCLTGDAIALPATIGSRLPRANARPASNSSSPSGCDQSVAVPVTGSGRSQFSQARSVRQDSCTSLSRSLEEGKAVRG